MVVTIVAKNGDRVRFTMISKSNSKTMLTTKFERAEFDEHGRITFMRYQLLYSNLQSENLFREYGYSFDDENETVTVAVLEYLPFTCEPGKIGGFCTTLTKHTIPNRNWKLPTRTNQ